MARRVPWTAWKANGLPCAGAGCKYWPRRQRLEARRSLWRRQRIELLVQGVLRLAEGALRLLRANRPINPIPGAIAGLRHRWLGLLLPLDLPLYPDPRCWVCAACLRCGTLADRPIAWRAAHRAQPPGVTSVPGPPRRLAIGLCARGLLCIHIFVL